MADIDVFQTVTSVSFQVEPNTNVININKVTVEAGGLQDLQSVTNVGANTTNSIIVETIFPNADPAISGISLSGEGVYGSSSETYGVHGVSISGDGVYGQSRDATGVYGYSTNGVGVSGYSLDGTAIQGISTNGMGMYGYSDNYIGVYSQSDTGVGLSAYSETGIPIETYGNGDGTPSIEVNLGNTNKGVVIESGTSSTGNPIEFNKNGVTKFVANQEGSVTANQVTLNTAPTETAVVGTTRWNNTTGTSETTLKGGTVVLKNGFDLLARIVNKVTPNQTLTKANYQAVRISGATGQRLSVQLAQGNTDLNSADTIGLVTETIATNQEGFIVTMGQIEEINTTGSLQGETWVDGDVLYLSPTIAGKLTNIKPKGATGHIIVIGYVEYAHAIHGKIYVKIMNGWELDELHNVFINNPLNNEGLFYESATQLWKNKPISTVLGYTPVASNTAIVGATKTKITYDSKGLVTSGIDATTADIADSVNRRYVTDAQQTVITNTSGTNTGDNATNTQYSGLATSKANVASPTFTGTVTTPAIIVSSETASTLASFDASKNIKSLPTTTYPSLTELSYAKGLTSRAQTQLDALKLELIYLDSDDTYFDSFYIRAVNDGATFEASNSLLSTMANLRSISYVNQGFTQQINADKFVQLGGTAEKYLMANGSALSNIATNTTTTALSLATLNITYPTAIIGFRVHCISITAGKLIYERTSTGWVSYSITTVI
jgi:nitrogen fixation protein